MEQDARYAYACRVGLLAGAAIHWVAAALILSDHFNTASSWQYAPRAVRAIASAILQALVGA